MVTRRITKHSLKIFTRWMSGTCLNCPLIDAGLSWKYNYTFYEDVVSIKDIVNLVINVHELAAKVVGEAKGFVSQ